MSVMKKALALSSSIEAGIQKLILTSVLTMLILVFSPTVSGQVKKVTERSRLMKLTDTLPADHASTTASRAGSVSFQTPARTSTPINHNIIRTNFQQPDSAVKFKVIKNGAVVRTETAKPNDIHLAAGEKVVYQPKKEITIADQATFNKLQAVSAIQFTREELKVVPEKTIEAIDSGDHQVSYQLYFFPYAPFTYNDSLKKFQSKMGFFFLRSDSSLAANPIDPVNIIVTSNDLKQVNPRPLQISHLNFPASDVDLAGDNLADSVEIRVITASRPEGYQTFLKIKPILEISTNRISLQGYGVQKIPVEVRLVGSNSSSSMKVGVTALKGTLMPDTFTLSYNKPQTIYLTSEGTGPTLISAKSSNLESNDLHLSYDFPWYFLLASIIGGLLGGFAKYYSGRKKKFSMRPMIGGVLAGLIGALAYYALGISLLKFKFSAEMNEFAVLALSALFGYFGLPKKVEA
jgi:hypothetical protein